MRVRRSPTLVVLVITALACRPEPTTTTEPATEDPTPVHDPAPTPTAEPTTTIAAPWSVAVADGSANVYFCEHALDGAPRFEYQPITPEESSTGTYSGGAPRSGPMTPAQVEALWREVAAAAANTAQHVPDRNKGTVAITATGPTNTRIIISGGAGGPLLAVLAALPDASTP